MKDGVRIGVAVGLGYLLGRTRKGRLALMLVGASATGRLGKGPATLVKQGADLLGSSPEVKTLADTVRGRLVDAGKAAAVSAVSSRVDTLTGKIEERTGALTSSPLGGQTEETDEDTDQDTDTGRGEDEREEQEEQEDAGDEEAAERRPPRSSPRRPRRSESADEPEDEDRADDRPRRPARPSGRRPPVRRTRRREQ